jgi:two-component system, NarL family, sensor histidine kinase UhpB
MAKSDQLDAPAGRGVRVDRAPPPDPEDGSGRAQARPLPMLWRVFAANAAVFAIAFAILALTPVTISSPIRLVELVVLLVGLIVMLLVDLLLLRQALAPIHRLVTTMERIDRLQPGQRAVGFERASSETLALAQAFNGMLDRLEAERRESSARALAAQEAERLRIARELHDEIGQTLTAVALRAEHAAGHGGPERRDLAELAEVVQQSLQDVRRISRELRPEALDELGLINALIALCARVTEQSGLRIHRRLQGGLPELSPAVELAIYRFAQEALTNAMRHSKASEATVSLRRESGELVLSVADNGQGLPEHVSESGGLTGMRERAMLIGAALTIASVPGAGVEVTMRLGLDGKT